MGDAHDPWEVCRWSSREMHYVVTGRPRRLPTLTATARHEVYERTMTISIGDAATLMMLYPNAEKTLHAEHVLARTMEDDQ